MDVWKFSYFLSYTCALTVFCLRPCRLQKDWQSLLRSLTPVAWREEIKERGLTTNPLSLHFTTKAHPSIPAVGEKEERTALTTTTTTTNRQWGEHRWEEGGKKGGRWRRVGKKEEEEKGQGGLSKWKRRGSLPQRWGGWRTETLWMGKRRKKWMMGEGRERRRWGWWLRGVEG